MTSDRSPTVTHYLERLAQELGPLPPTEREDVLKEIASHFDDGISAGESAETIVTRMGAPEKVAEDLVRERLVTIDLKRSPFELAAVVFRAAGLPFVWAFGIFLVFNVLSVLFAYGKLVTDPQVMFRLLLLNIPAILVITIPLAVLFIGLSGLPTLARELSRSMFERLLPGIVAIILGLGVMASVASYALDEAVVIPANRAVVDLVRTQLNNMGQPVAMRELSAQEMNRPELRSHMRKEHKAYLAMLKKHLAKEKIIEKERQNVLLHTDYEFKLAIPALSIGTAALGLALGMLFTRRQRRRTNVAAVIVGIGTLFATYLVLTLSRAAAPFIGTHRLAWLPLLFLLVMAGLTWWLGRLARTSEAVDA